MDITEFSEFFENQRVKVIGELVSDYQCIGDQYQGVRVLVGPLLLSGYQGLSIGC